MEKIARDFDLDYAFFDESFGKLMEKERQSSVIVTLFTALSLCVTSIGLIGLISYTAAQFKKEIAIRKILGSTVTDIFRLLSIRFFLLISVAVLISIPAIFKLTNYWLSNFEYRIYLEVWDVVNVVVLVFLFSLEVLWKQTFSAAKENPINPIRRE